MKGVIAEALNFLGSRGKVQTKAGIQDKTLILCDFDGTASAVDVGYQLLKKFSEDEWAAIDRDYCSGLIGSMEAYSRIASIIHASQEEFLDYLPNLTRL